MKSKIVDSVLSLFSRSQQSHLLTETEVEFFLSFYRQQAESIMRHREFEKDLKANVRNSEKLILEYKTEDYVRKIHQYFIEKEFYEHVSEYLFEKMILQILAPDQVTRDLIQRNVRKEIFNETLLLIADQSRIDIKSLIRSYYERIASLAQGLNGLDRDELTQLFRECMENLDVDRIRREEAVKPSSGHERSSLSILHDVMQALGIRRRQDLERYFSRSLHLRYLAAAVVWGLCWGAVWVAPAFNFMQSVLALLEPLQMMMIRYSLLIVFGVLFLATWFEFVVTLDRRKRIRRVVHLLVTVLKIPPDTIQSWFRDTYYFNYRDL